MGPSFALALPVFLVGLAVNISFALLLAFFRATYLDTWGVVLCVAMMSVSTLFYIIGGQYLVAKLWHLVPISGFAGGLDALRFLVLPVIVGVDQRLRQQRAPVPHAVPGGNVARTTCAPRGRRGSPSAS